MKCYINTSIYDPELIAEFTETDLEIIKKKNVEKVIKNKGTEVAVLEYVVDLNLSIHKLANVSGINRRSVHVILIIHYLHFFKIKLVHEINEDFDA